MGGGTHPLRDDGIARRANQARTALIEAAKRLLADAPSGTFGVGAVTREAGVPRSTFHDHFRSLDDLIAATLDGVHRALTDRVAAAVADSPDATTSMVRGMVVVMGFGALHPLDARLLLAGGPGSSDPAHPSNRELAKSLHAGIAAGEFALRDVTDGIVMTRAVADVGLARMLEARHDAGAVRDLTVGVCVTLARAIGVDTDRIDALVEDAIARCMPPATALRTRHVRRSRSE